MFKSILLGSNLNCIYGSTKKEGSSGEAGQEGKRRERKRKEKREKGKGKRERKKKKKEIM